MIYHDIVYNITKELTLYGEDTMSFNLTGLDEFREYKISVAGMNKMGIGPFISTKAITDEDGKYCTGKFTIQTNYIQHNKIQRR